MARTKKKKTTTTKKIKNVNIGGGVQVNVKIDQSKKRSYTKKEPSTKEPTKNDLIMAALSRPQYIGGNSGVSLSAIADIIKSVVKAPLSLSAPSIAPPAPIAAPVVAAPPVVAAAPVVAAPPSSEASEKDKRKREKLEMLKERLRNMRTETENIKKENDIFEETPLIRRKNLTTPITDENPRPLSDLSETPFGPPPLSDLGTPVGPPPLSRVNSLDFSSVKLRKTEPIKKPEPQKEKTILTDLTEFSKDNLRKAETVKREIEETGLKAQLKENLSKKRLAFSDNENSDDEDEWKDNDTLPPETALEDDTKELNEKERELKEQLAVLLKDVTINDDTKIDEIIPTIKKIPESEFIDLMTLNVKNEKHLEAAIMRWKNFYEAIQQDKKTYAYVNRDGKVSKINETINKDIKMLRGKFKRIKEKIS